jgi:hypothetical protein
MTQTIPRLAVIGPPGTDKTKFARALGRWDGWNEWTKPVVLDNYVPKLAKKTGLALGPWATYVENLMVAGERMKLESAHSALSTITVGTILDTLMYAHMHADVTLHRPELDRQTSYWRAQVAIQALTMWYTETWQYTLAFFLPFPAHSNGLSWERDYAHLLPEVIETYQVPGIVTIPEGSVEERVKLATEVIQIARAEEDSGDQAVSVPKAVGL